MVEALETARAAFSTYPAASKAPLCDLVALGLRCLGQAQPSSGDSVDDAPSPTAQGGGAETPPTSESKHAPALASAVDGSPTDTIDGEAPVAGDDKRQEQETHASSAGGETEEEPLLETVMKLYRAQFERSGMPSTVRARHKTA